jgi:hypothetical protein
VCGGGGCMGDDHPGEKILSPDGLWTGQSLPVATTAEFVKLDLRPGTSVRRVKCGH